MQIFFDGHNDSLTKHYPPRHLRASEYQIIPHSFVNGLEKCHIDLPKMEKAGFKGGLFAVFIDPEPEEISPEEIGSSYLKAHKRQTGVQFPLPEPPIDAQLALKSTLEVLSRAYKDERFSKGRIKIIRSAEDLNNTLKTDCIAEILHLEGCEAIDIDLHNLEVLYQAGVRSIGICWSRPNIFGTGVPFAYDTLPNVGPGLSAAGTKLIKYCDDMGILVDLAHLNYAGFCDAASVTKNPLIISHTGAFALCPSARNLTDDQIKKAADSNGIIGVTFHVPDLLGPENQCADTIIPGRTLSPIEAIAAHIHYIGKTAGFDHVALGSDFDGCTIPEEMHDVLGLEKLSDALKSFGLTDEEMHKVCFGNWIRVLKNILH